MTRATIVDFIENALGSSVVEIGRLADERPGELIARRDAFYGAMDTSWAGLSVDSLDQVAEGELRPIYARGLLTSRGAFSSLYAESKNATRLAREIKALLLYSHSTVLLNPLLPAFGVTDGAIRTEETPAGMDFVRALRAVVEISPLIRDGVVLVTDPPAIEFVEVPDLESQLGRAVHKLDAGNLHVDEENLYQLGVDVLLRLLLHGAIDPSETHGAFVGSAASQGRSISDFITELVSRVDADRLSLLPAQETKLESLLRISLPGVDQLAPADMVLIRSDDSFSQFRADVRIALAAAREALGADDLDSARQEIAEYMGARASQLKKSKARTRFWSASAGDSINWIVGASMTALAGWQAALLGLLAKGVFEAVRTTPGKAERALVGHYVALAGQQKKDAGTDARSIVRRWRENS